MHTITLPTYVLRETITAFLRDLGANPADVASLTIRPGKADIELFARDESGNLLLGRHDVLTETYTVNVLDEAP